MIFAFKVIEEIEHKNIWKNSGHFLVSMESTTESIKTGHSPLVSVLMTAYNREQFIAEAIESVLSSTYQNFELIIVDDCSRDNTVEIAQRYEKQDARVKVYQNEKNLGDYPNRNRAIGYATGEFIMFVDSDDQIFEDGIERCVKAMVEHPYCDFGIRFKQPLNKEVEIQPETAIHQHFFKKPFLLIGPGGTIIRKSFFETICRYPEKYGPANDMFFNLKAACKTNILLLPFEFVHYRRHSGQEINNQYSYLYNNYRYLNDALSQLPLPISPRQKRWLSLKNKRRFTVNITKFFLRTFDIKRTRNAIQLAGFKINDALQGIFH